MVEMILKARQSDADRVGILRISRWDMTDEHLLLVRIIGFDVFGII
jgi:hypothetical protein